MFTLFSRTAIRTVNLSSISKSLGMTLPSFQSRNCGSNYFKSHDEINAFMPKHRLIREAIKKENIPIYRLMDHNIADLKRWNHFSIQDIHRHGHLEFQTFLSLSSLEKNKLCDLLHHYSMWCRLALDAKIVTIQELIDNPLQDSADFILLTAGITGSPYWYDIKSGYEYPTCSVTFDEFIKLSPQNRKELCHSSMNLWKNEFTIDEFFALPKVDRDDLRDILFSTLGQAALIQQQINIKQFLAWSPQQRIAIYDLLYSDDDHGTAKYQIPYNNRVFNHPSFNLVEFVNLSAAERKIMKDSLMSEESIGNKNGFN